MEGTVREVLRLILCGFLLKLYFEKFISDARSVERGDGVLCFVESGKVDESISLGLSRFLIANHRAAEYIPVLSE